MQYTKLVIWTVYFRKKAHRQLDRLPVSVRESVAFLRAEIEVLGPMRFNWKNFGKLKGSENRYHCHVKSGRPTYVVCWEVTDKTAQTVEVYYVGTHEKISY